MSDFRQSERILTVSALTESLRENLEKRFPFVWVGGEVTNFSKSAAGHIYFSLKDEEAQLRCVWFSGKQRRGRAGHGFDPLTGEVFDSPGQDPAANLRNGLHALCAGAITIYAPRGEYRLLVDFVMPGGEGSLARIFEARKQKLAALGYFNLERKRPLPQNPARVALIASPGGAAIHDFLRISQNRGTGAIIRLFPAPAQGEGAAEKIAAAMALANSQNWAEVIALIRGGGSLEDLWAFNEEILAEAVHNSALPVLAGIGHEVDFTLADLAADVRAATPSHAAQLLWPLRGEIWQKLDDLDFALPKLAENLLKGKAESLEKENRALGWLSPQNRLKRLCAERERESAALDRLIRRLLETKALALRNVEERRLAWRPLDRLESRNRALNLASANLRSRMGPFLSERAGAIALSENRLESRFARFFRDCWTRYENLENSLQNLDPLRPMQRGYALLRGRGGIVHSVNDCEKGDNLRAQLADGILDLKVQAVTRREKCQK